MTSRILTLIAAMALSGPALAHGGHIADTGQGHAHWPLYLLLGGILFALAAVLRAYQTRR